MKDILGNWDRFLETITFSGAILLYKYMVPFSCLLLCIIEQYGFSKLQKGIILK